MGLLRNNLHELNAKLGQLLFAEGEQHAAYVPWSNYVRTRSGRKIKEAVTSLLPPKRLMEQEADPNAPGEYIQKPATKRMINEAGEYHDYPLHTKGRSRFDTKKYLKARFETEGAPYTAKIEALKHGAGTVGKSESDVLGEIQGLLAQRKLRNKELYESYKKQALDKIATDIGGSHKVGAKEVHKTLHGSVLPGEMARHRSWMAGELGGVINPAAPEGQRFRSTGARAIIKARGVNPAVAKAYPERLTEYHKRLEGLVEQHQIRANDILTHGERHLDRVIARGMERSQEFPKAAPEELASRARDLRSYISHPEPHLRHHSIPETPGQPIKSNLAKYLSLGMGREVTHQDVDNIKERATSILNRSMGDPGARAAILKKESSKIFRAPLIEQVKGYPYLGKAGRALGIGAGLIGGGILAKKLLSRKQEPPSLPEPGRNGSVNRSDQVSRRNRMIHAMAAKLKLHRFETFQEDPLRSVHLHPAVDEEAMNRIMQNVSMDFFKEHNIIRPKLAFPTSQKIGAMKMLRHLVAKHAIHPDAVAHLATDPEWIKNPQLDLVNKKGTPIFRSPEIIAAQSHHPIPTLHDKWQEAEAKRLAAEEQLGVQARHMRLTDMGMAAERAARGPQVAGAYKKGRAEERASYLKDIAARDIQKADLLKAHGREIGALKKAAGRAKYIGAGVAGAGLLGGYLIARNRQQDRKKPVHQFAIYDYDEKKSSPELADEDPQWLKNVARKSLYGRDYNTRAQAQSIKKWGGRTSRLLGDLRSKAKGEPSLDARGRPRKSEWEKPWVAGALTTGALVTGLVGLRKGVRVIRAAPLESKLGQLREGFVRADYAKKVPGLQKVGQFYQGVRKDISNLVNKPAKNPKYKFSLINPATGKMKTESQIGKEVEKADQLKELREIAEGKKKAENKFKSKLRAIRFQSEQPQQKEDKPLTKKQKEKLLLEGSGGAALLAALILRRRGGGGQGGVHIHNYPKGGVAHIAEQSTPKGVFFQVDPTQQKKKTDDDGDNTLGHDVAVGAIEGAAGTAVYDRLLKKYNPKSFLGKSAIAAGIGGVATGTIGVALNRLIRKKVAQRKAAKVADQPSTDMRSKKKLIQFQDEDQEEQRNRPRFGTIARDTAIGGAVGAAGTGLLLAGTGLALGRKAPDLSHMLTTAAKQHVGVFNLRKSIPTFRSLPEASRLFGKQLKLVKAGENLATSSQKITQSSLKKQLSGVGYQDVHDIAKYKSQTGHTPSETMEKAVGMLSGVAATGVGAIGGAATSSGWKPKEKEQQPYSMASKIKTIRFAIDPRYAVARDRYKKQIHERDIETANRQYIHSALLGAGIGGLVRGKRPFSRAALTGAGIGIGAQALTRAATASTKDQFGERSFVGKRINKAPTIAGGLTVGGLLARKLYKSTRFSNRRKPIHFSEDDHAKLIGGGTGIAGLLAGGLYPPGTHLKKGEDITGKRIMRRSPRNPILQHEGIGVGGGKVAEVYRTPSMTKGVVRIISKEKFSKGKPVRVLDERVNPTAAKRAIKSVGSKSTYSYLRNNCQTFTEAALKGRRRALPRQLRTALVSGGLAAAAGYGAAHEFGVRTLKTGQIVRWGKHLPKNLPIGYTGTGKGTYQILDKPTKSVMLVQRGREGMAEDPTKWWKHKYSYISDLNVPKKYRGTIEGGKALAKMTGTVLGHFDKAGVRAATTAGAYEAGTVAERQAQTHGLVRGYQKRGFRMTSGTSVNNEWNVGMTRPPGAKPIKPISAARFNTYAEKSRLRAAKREGAEVREHLKPLVPGVGTLATGAGIAGTAYEAHREDGKHKETAKKLLLPAVGVGGLVAGIKAPALYKHLRENSYNLGAAAVERVTSQRLRIGKRLSLAGGRFLPAVGKHLLRGFA